MAGQRFRKKLLWILVAIVSLLVLLVAALPLWFPLALRPIAKRLGASYSQYQRIGYQRFRLSGVTWTNRDAQVEAHEATAFVPSVWLWRHYTGNSNETFLTVTSWKYSPAGATQVSSKAPASAYGIFQNIKKLAHTLKTWLPTADLANGTIVIKKGTLAVPQAIWAKGNLAASVAVSNQPPFAVTLATPKFPWKLDFNWEAQQLRSSVTLEDRAEKLIVSGTADWLTNHFVLAAEFPDHGLTPETASLRADSFDVPARLFGLEQYSDITGALRAGWKTNHFDAQLIANAVPQGTNLPPLEVQLNASGDTNAARLDIAKISGPGLRADLPAPAVINYRPPFLSQPTALEVVADLDQLSVWSGAASSQELQGKLSGKAVVYPAGGIPRVTFTLVGTSVSTALLTTSNLDVNAELNWPLVELKSSHIKMDDGSDVSLTGAFDVKQKVVSNGRLQSAGTFGGQFLPADYSFGSASVTAQFGGPLKSLTNSVRAEVKHLIIPRANPMDVQAAWNGEGLTFTNLEARLTAGGSALTVGGSGTLEGKNKTVTLTQLELSQGNKAALSLQKPVRISMSTQAATTTNASLALNMEPLVLAGTDRQLRMAADVDWPQRGTLDCDAEGLDARLLADFIPQANAEAVLARLSFSGGWTNGPMTFQLASDATLKTKEKIPFSATAKLSGGSTGITIERLSISSATQAVCSMQGSLPIFCDPTRRDSVIQIDTEAPLRMQASTDPNSVLWEKIGAETGLRLSEPRLAANLSGTWKVPKGQVTLQVRRVELPLHQRPVPAVENLDFLAEMDRTAARVSRCNFQIAGQPVTFTGEVPLGESFWSNLRHQRRLPDWHDATGNLRIQNAELAAFNPFMPQLLSPEGSASADISLERGGNLRGEFSIRNARTYPLESIGPVRNIQALARLDGQTVRLERASAEIGGQRVNVDGNVELSQQLLRTKGLPPFQVHLTGTNVPLARNPSVLLRADLDLAVSNSSTETPLVSGTVTLTNSLFLADLKSLVPERTASPRQRPPYFSVEAEPWANWRLKLKVQGVDFLRVRTPLFQGKVSTALTLSGTLKSPVALGQAQIDSGSTVIFPFSTLDVRQGFVSLTSENPYRPTLFVDAQGKRFGYDVKMQATGPVDDPVIQFSSIPSLSSEQIVLMLTAGEVPASVGATATVQQRAGGLGVYVGRNLLSDFGIGGGQERLTVRSGQYISESGRQTYDIELKLTDRWSVIGSYDRFDQYDLDLKWKVFSK
jgi:translocation and assembly module TamB